MAGKPTGRTVIVVGGGLAGMSASIEAERNGALVYLIDKEKRLGGNSAKASSGINAIDTPAQRAAQSTDNPHAFYTDTIRSGGGLCNPDLVKILVHNSTTAVEFLTSFGLSLDILSQCGGHSHPRTHRARGAGNVGWEITSKLANHVNATQSQRIKIITEAKVDELLFENGRVTGVKYTKAGQQHSLLADAVILTTGGFSADRNGLLKEYAPSLAGLPTTNGPFALGEGVKLAKKIGANLIHMDKVQVHPTGYVDPKNPSEPTKFLAPEALRGSGGILVNSAGERFVNELGLRNEVTHAIFQHCSPFPTESNNGPITAYLILNDEAVNMFQSSALDFYKAKGLIRVFNNAAELSSALNLPKEALLKTFQEYNEAAAQGKDKFGKTVFPVKSFSPEEKLHVAAITPSIHYTMGGIEITERTQALNEQHEPIPGLYAAGEASGGVHGENRLAGNSLLECVVFGRIAGLSASK